MRDPTNVTQAARGDTSAAEGVTSAAEGVTSVAQGVTSPAGSVAPVADGATSVLQGATSVLQGVTPDPQSVTSAGQSVTPDPQGVMQVVEGVTSEAEGVTPAGQSVTPDPQGVMQVVEGGTSEAEGVAGAGNTVGTVVSPQEIVQPAPVAQSQLPPLIGPSGVLGQSPPAPPSLPGTPLDSPLTHGAGIDNPPAGAPLGDAMRDGQPPTPTEPSSAVDVGGSSVGATPTRQLPAAGQSAPGAGDPERAAMYDDSASSGEGSTIDALRIAGTSHWIAPGGNASAGAGEMDAAAVTSADPSRTGEGARVTRANTGADMPQAATGERATILDVTGFVTLRASDAADRART